MFFKFKLTVLSHSCSMKVNIVWELTHQLPVKLFTWTKRHNSLTSLLSVIQTLQGSHSKLLPWQQTWKSRHCMMWTWRGFPLVGWYAANLFNVAHGDTFNYSRNIKLFPVHRNLLCVLTVKTWITFLSELFCQYLKKVILL